MHDGLLESLQHPADQTADQGSCPCPAHVAQSVEEYQGSSACLECSVDGRPVFHQQALGKVVNDGIQGLLTDIEVLDDLAQTVHHGYFVTNEALVCQSRLRKIAEDLKEDFWKPGFRYRYRFFEILGQVGPVLGVNAVHWVLIDDLLEQFREGIHMPQVHLRAGGGR